MPFPRASRHWIKPSAHGQCGWSWITSRGESAELMALGRLYGKTIRPAWWSEKQVQTADRVDEERARLLKDEEVEF